MIPYPITPISRIGLRPKRSESVPPQRRENKLHQGRDGRQHSQLHPAGAQFLDVKRDNRHDDPVAEHDDHQGEAENVDVSSICCVHFYLPSRLFQD